MTPRLLLYIEEDYILPLAIDADGKVHEYAKDDENRLWLYFNCAEHSVDYARKYRTSAAAGEYSYYGSIFKNIATANTAIIDGRDLPYFDLLKLSPVLTNIKQFYIDNTGDMSVNISTSFVFGESIGFDARKQFISSMAKNGFTPVSFSKTLSAVLIDYACRSMPDVKFGDHTLVITSAADTLRLTSAVFDGDKWLSDGTFELIEGVGDAPLKKAFIKYVVEQVDRNRGYLTTREKFQKECEWQNQNAERWLSRADSAGNIFISDFAYSFDADVKYSCDVSKRFLDAVLEDAVRNAVSQIISFKNRVMGTHIAYAIFCGPAFDDNDFVNMMRSSLDNPTYLCLSSYLMPKALSVFFEKYYDLADDFDKYDLAVAAMQKSSAAISTWVESAGKIRDLWEGLKETVPELKAALTEDLKRYDEMVQMCDERLSHSDFKGAYDKLNTYLLPSTRTSTASRAVNEYIRKANELHPVFDKIKSVDGARIVVEQITAECDNVLSENGLITIARALPTLLDRKRNDGSCADENQRDSVAYYESHYDEYVDLKSRFNLSNNIREKRELIALMEKITKEPLPEVTIRHVAVELFAELKVEKTGFLGLKTKKELHYSVKVRGNETLPCDAVINISTNVQQKANEGSSTCVAIEIPKGESYFEGVLPLPDSRIQEDKPIYVFIFVAPDVLDKEALEANPNYRIIRQ